MINAHTREELYEVLYPELARLRKANERDFNAWYEQANLVDVRDYCFTGWILDRKLSPPPLPRADEP